MGAIAHYIIILAQLSEMFDDIQDLEEFEDPTLFVKNNSIKATIVWTIQDDDYLSLITLCSNFILFGIPSLK